MFAPAHVALPQPCHSLAAALCYALHIGFVPLRGHVYNHVLCDLCGAVLYISFVCCLLLAKESCTPVAATNPLQSSRSCVGLLTLHWKHASRKLRGGSAAPRGRQFRLAVLRDKSLL